MELIAARHQWFADGKPLVTLPPTPRHDPKDEHPHVWASSLGTCCWAHACRRANMAPVYPPAAERSDDLLTLFHYGNMVEEMWLNILIHWYNHPKRALIGRQFWAGVRVDGSQHGISGYLDGLLVRDFEQRIPVEIKFSADFTVKASQFSQVVAYLYEMEFTEGWLIVSHVDGTFTGGRVICEGGVYRLFRFETDELYTSYRRPFVETKEQVAERIIAHNIAYQMAAKLPVGVWNAGCLPAPFFGQCLSLNANKTSVSPACPYFCWGEPKPYYPYKDKVVSISGKEWTVYNGNR